MNCVEVVGDPTGVAVSCDGAGSGERVKEGVGKICVGMKAVCVAESFALDVAVALGAGGAGSGAQAAANTTINM